MKGKELSVGHGFDTMAHYRDCKRQIFGPKELAMRSLRCFATCLLIVFSLSAPGVAQEAEEHGHSIWKNADLDRPEVATAKEFLGKVTTAP
jgi:hypothetical protein